MLLKSTLLASCMHRQLHLDQSHLRRSEENIGKEMRLTSRASDSTLVIDQKFLSYHCAKSLKPLSRE